MLRRAPAANPPPTPTILTSLPAEVANHEAVLASLPTRSARPPSPNTLTRYLRARSNDPTAAAALLSTALSQEASSPAPQTCALCASAPQSHSFYPIGPSATTEPVVYSNYAATDTSPAGNGEHMRFAMAALFSEGVPRLARMTWVMDMRFFGLRHASPAVAKEVLGMFASLHPERLQCAVVYDAPSLFFGLFKAVSLFADPVTVAKVVFVKHNLGARRAQLEAVGIQGDCLDRLLTEIDEARAEKKIFEKKNWWTVKPLEPIVHIGGIITSSTKS